jgi:hypothetical protein
MDVVLNYDSVVRHVHNVNDVVPFISFFVNKSVIAMSLEVNYLNYMQ